MKPMLGILTSTGEFYTHEPPYAILQKDNEEIELYLSETSNFNLSNINWQVLPLGFEVEKI